MTMTPEMCMKKCQQGTNSQSSANSLHAECYGNIGRLLTENARLKEYIGTNLAAHIRQLNAQYKAAEELLASYMMRHDTPRYKNSADLQDAVVSLIAARIRPLEDV